MLRSYTLTNRRLFIRKITSLCVGTLLFIPLVYYKWETPAYVYAGALLLLHLVFLWLYFSRTPWRQLLQHRAGFTLRSAAVLFCIYLLSLIKFGGSPGIVVMKVLFAFAIHVGILLGLMAVKREPEAAAAKTRPGVIQ